MTEPEASPWPCINGRVRLRPRPARRIRYPVAAQLDQTRVGTRREIANPLTSGERRKAGGTRAQAARQERGSVRARQSRSGSPTTSREPSAPRAGFDRRFSRRLAWVCSGWESCRGIRSRTSSRHAPVCRRLRPARSPKKCNRLRSEDWRAAMPNVSTCVRRVLERTSNNSTRLAAIETLGRIAVVIAKSPREIASHCAPASRHARPRCRNSACRLRARTLPCWTPCCETSPLTIPMFDCRWSTAPLAGSEYSKNRPSRPLIPHYRRRCDKSNSGILEKFRTMVDRIDL